MCLGEWSSFFQSFEGILQAEGFFLFFFSRKFLIFFQSFKVLCM